MTVRIEFTIPDHYTIAKQKEILNNIEKADPTCEVGGEGNIIYYLGGDVICEDIEDEYVPGILEVIFDAECWPSNIELYGTDLNKYFDRAEWDSLLEEYFNDCAALWNGLKANYGGGEE